MELLIDHADIGLIEQIYGYWPVDGVTTNPTILSRVGGDPMEVLGWIRDLIGSDALHVQAVSPTAEGMEAEARRIVERLGEETFIKIPAVKEGYKAIRSLSQQGFRITATAVYTLRQALFAAKAGALYAAPYVDRVDDRGGDGVALACQMHDLFRRHGWETKVLAASFKNARQLTAVAAHGIEAVTVSPDLLERTDPAVDAAVETFRRDFEDLCGAGKTMADCL